MPYAHQGITYTTGYDRYAEARAEAYNEPYYIPRTHARDMEARGESFDFRRGRHEAWTLYQTGRATLLRAAPMTYYSDAWKAGYMSIYNALRLRWEKQLAKIEREQTEAAIMLSAVRQAYYLDTAGAVPFAWVEAAYERRNRADAAAIEHLCVASHAIDRVPLLPPPLSSRQVNSH